MMAGGQDHLIRAEYAAADDVVAPSSAMVIFGAAGDLTKRLVVPALYNLVNAKQLPEGFQLIGVDLADKTQQDWRDGLTNTMNEFVARGGGEFQADHIDQSAWRWLTDRMSYLEGDLNDPGIPDRSFPRQGNGAEHHGAALRQWFVRAALESPAH
jgi:glucose-6-phosphate 1-dehydrogenase